MKKILAFGASSSTTSINHKLAKYASDQIKDAEINLIDLNDFEMPIFSVDKEQDNGIPEKAKQFKELIREADGVLISFAEHNGSYSTAFKNIFDWSSRIEKEMWLNKLMFLLATSPGPRGGKSVLGLAVNDFPHRAGQVIASFSLPSFHQNFSDGGGIADAEIKAEFEEQLARFEKALS